MKKLIQIVLLAGILLSYISARAGTISGQVVDERTGEPFQYVTVTLERETILGEETIFQSYKMGSTNETGTFTFIDLEAGNYQVVVTVTGISGNNYLPEAYDNVPEYDTAGRTTISLAQDQVVDDLFIELDERPYYITRLSWEPVDFLEKGGKGQAIVTVMNTTRRNKEMIFWLTFQAERQVENVYNGLSALFPGLTPDDLHTLTPGQNTIKLPVFLPKRIGAHTRLLYKISGGLNQWQPILPDFGTISIRKGVLIIAHPRQEIPSEPLPPIVITPSPEPLPPKIIVSPLEQKPKKNGTAIKPQPKIIGPQ